MSSKLDLEHEKPDVVDEQQPTVKKVRLAVEAVTVLDKKEGEASAATDAAQDAGASNDEDTSAENSPKADDDGDDEPTGAAASADGASSAGSQRDDTAAASEDAGVTAPNTSGSAFGGFAAFSGTSGFSAFAASSNSSGGGFGAFASSGGGFGAFASSSSGGGFAAFGAQSEAAAASGGFGTTASASESVEFGSSEVKKSEPAFVPALTDAEIANGEEGEQILVEKRAKLFKLAGQDYAEVGIGPLRVLKAASSESATGKSSVRVVMRRESYPRGPGTKLLLNARLNACLACIEKTEKAMLLTIVETVSAEAEDASADGAGAGERPAEAAEAAAAPSEGEGESAPKIAPSTYLVRFGSSDDFQSVLARIRPWLPSAASSSS